MMDAALDEDFVNFEAFSQTCSAAALASGPDEDIRLLDNEARQRERKIQGEKSERNNNVPQSGASDEREMKSPSQGLEESGGPGSAALSPEYHLFTTFSYNSTSKKLTMIPVKYKIKEERRKVLKISVNKLKKIDDPESWLCRSVLINNTMKKLQKETRDEKVNKQLNAMTYPKNYLPKTTDADEFGCQLSGSGGSTSSNNNNNNNNEDEEDAVARAGSGGGHKSENNNGPGSNDNNNVGDKVFRVEVTEGTECFYRTDADREGYFRLAGSKSEEFLFQADKPADPQARVESPGKAPEEDSPEEKLAGSLSEGVPINEDFVEKIPSIKRCSSRKKSLDEDGTPDEILRLNESTEPGRSREEEKPGDPEDVDECDVHDVLSQLYMPPTPRMLTSIDSDTDEDELNVVDIDSSYIDGIKSECDKLPSSEGLFDDGGGGGGGGVVLLPGGKKDREDEGEARPAKRRRLDDVFNCFAVCGESYDNFLCSNRTGEDERTSGETCRGDGAGGRTQAAEEDQLIELEDEEDIKRRLSQSLSGHYHRKPEKAADNFFEESCDNQYSCGHTVTMFGDMQSVTFHNLIASLET